MLDPLDRQALPIAAIVKSPFQVGRGDRNALILRTRSASMLHAEFRIRKSELWLEDLESTNGTYLNGERIGQAVRLEDGDLVRFGDLGFSVAWRLQPASRNNETLAMNSADLAPAERKQRLQRLISERALLTRFQPIVRLEDGVAIGYECLARGEGHGLDGDPASLFGLATEAGLAGILSEVCREQAFAVEGLGSLLDRLPPLDAFGLFSNLHAQELRAEGFIDRLQQLLRGPSQFPFVVEISEKSILDTATFLELMGQLRDARIAVAFDDFGAGLDRLKQLAHCTPDLLKFDRSLIAELTPENGRLRRLLRSLVSVATELGCVTIAEGIETEEQHSMCIDLGFDLAQGFLLGRPSSIDELL